MYGSGLTTLGSQTPLRTMTLLKSTIIASVRWNSCSSFPLDKCLNTLSLGRGYTKPIPIFTLEGKEKSQGWQDNSENGC